METLAFFMDWHGWRTHTAAYVAQHLAPNQRSIERNTLALLEMLVMSADNRRECELFIDREMFGIKVSDSMPPDDVFCLQNACLIYPWRADLPGPTNSGAAAFVDALVKITWTLAREGYPRELWLLHTQLAVERAEQLRNDCANLYLASIEKLKINASLHEHWLGAPPLLRFVSALETRL